MSDIPNSVLPNACFVIIYFLDSNSVYNTVKAFAKNSSFDLFGFDCVSAKIKCTICAVGFFYMPHSMLLYSLPASADKHL